MRLLWSLFLVPGLILVPCRHDPPPQTPQPASETGPPGETCQRVCWRTFGTCTREVLSVTVRVPPRKLQKYEQAGLLRAYRAAGFQRCMDMCGRAPATEFSKSLLARCMRLPTCSQYAACISPRGGLPGAEAASDR